MRAVIAFKNFHPNVRHREIINCASIYDEDEWQTTAMAEADSNYDHGCWEQITVTVEKEPYYEDHGNVALIVEHVSYSRTIIDNE